MSGKRSAILPLGNKYYRLKGCGMNQEGFINRYNYARDLETKLIDPDSSMIGGSHFYVSLF